MLFPPHFTGLNMSDKPIPRPILWQDPVEENIFDNASSRF